MYGYSDAAASGTSRCLLESHAKRSFQVQNHTNLLAFNVCIMIFSVAEHTIILYSLFKLFFTFQNEFFFYLIFFYFFLLE